ncbi:MAG: chorismate mutase [Candidatus Izemoplasmataceae bacterium]|jgi:monofunctional chorismate mutase
MEKIDQLRKEIDLIDESLMNLLEKRFNYVLKIGELKKQSSVHVLDQNREQIILNKINSFSHNEAIYHVYLSLLDVSKRLQRKL